MTHDFVTEAERIIDEFRRRDRVTGDFYALYHPVNLFHRHELERALCVGLRAAGKVPCGALKFLDVGCGAGTALLTIYELLGAQAENLAGIELDSCRAAACTKRFPQSDIRAGNATSLPWPDGQFDVVSQATVFSSVLDRDMKRAIAGEMLRVLKPEGCVLWHDFRYNNPRNPHVRGIAKREIRELFPDCDLRLWRVTLAPPLARRIVPVSWTLASVVESLRVLNTHYFGVFRRKHDR